MNILLALIPIIFILIFLGLMVWATVFWILMLVDLLRRKDWKDENEIVIWIVLMVAVGIIGSAIYYFEIYKKRGKAKG